MTDDVTLQRRFPLTGRIHKMNPAEIFSRVSSWRIHHFVMIVFSKLRVTVERYLLHLRQNILIVKIFSKLFCIFPYLNTNWLKSKIQVISWLRQSDDGAIMKS